CSAMCLDQVALPFQRTDGRVLSAGQQHGCVSCLNAEAATAGARTTPVASASCLAIALALSPPLSVDLVRPHEEYDSGLHRRPGAKSASVWSGPDHRAERRP